MDMHMHKVKTTLPYGSHESCGVRYDHLLPAQRVGQPVYCPRRVRLQLSIGLTV